MTDKKKLKEIKKLADAMYHAAQYLTTDASRLYKAMDEYHKFIIHEYFNEEPVSEELEKASIIHSEIVRNTSVIDEDFIDGAKWQKEQMMAKAIDVTVHIDAGGYPYIPQMELYDYDKDIPLAKKGDKYKVVLIKES